MPGRDSDGIRTARLMLRRWRSDDIAPFARINADAEVARYLSGRPMSRRETADFVKRIRRHWDNWGYGLWAVEHLADGQLIGFIGLSHHRWYPDEVEVGWRLDSRYWSRGLATEGAAVALRHGFAKIGLSRVISIIHRDNVASRRVAEKIGLRLWKEETHPEPETERPLPIVVYAIERTDWQAARK